MTTRRKRKSFNEARQELFVIPIIIWRSLYVHEKKIHEEKLHKLKAFSIKALAEQFPKIK